MAERKRWQGLRVLLTGATGGIGRRTAHALREQGATILASGRSTEAVELLVDELIAAGGTAAAFAADLSSLEETMDLGHRVLDAGRIDVVINNAGVGFGRDRERREVSADGYELRFAVNFLAPLALSDVLVGGGDSLRAVINVASSGQAALDEDDWMSSRRYDGVVAYRRSKLALVMLTFELAASHPHLACNVLHPGTFLDTTMVREAGILPQGPARRGAEVIGYVLGQALAEGVTGRYFDETLPGRAHEQAYDSDLRARVVAYGRRCVDDATHAPSTARAR